MTRDFIEFARLRPRIGYIPPERLALLADFSVATPRNNAMFNLMVTSDEHFICGGFITLALLSIYQAQMDKNSYKISIQRIYIPPTKAMMPADSSEVSLRSDSGEDEVTTFVTQDICDSAEVYCSAISEVPLLRDKLFIIFY
jgi:hypothetical protein